ncbi:MAG TPA: hypothetical protein VJ892_00285 [Candidatus Absconditabacterales bacterium]|nr:hypothetical protein [Candidatus Absconditabacterales bacterium]
MVIKNKTKDDMLIQVNSFLESISQKGEISEKTRDNILSLLDGEQGFLSWLKKRLGLDLDLYDKKELNKKLSKILKNEASFDIIWQEYISKMKKDRLDKLYLTKAKKRFEPHKTLNKDINDKIISFIRDLLKSKSEEDLKKLGIILDSSLWKNSKFEENGIYFVGDVFPDIVKNLSIDELNILLRFEDQNRVFLSEINQIKTSNGDIIKIFRLILDNFNLKKIFDLDKNYNHFKNQDMRSYDTIKSNISLLKNKGYDIENILPKNIVKKDLSKYINILNESNIIENRENSLNIISDFDLYNINTLLSRRPTTHYEGNGDYTSTIVEMEGGDWNNDKITEDFINSIFGYVDEHSLIFLKKLRTSYWTDNWQKNINFAKNEGVIKSNKIFSFEELYGDRAEQNEIIARLKTVSNKSIAVFFEKLKNLGMETLEQRKKILKIILIFGGKLEVNIDKINILIDNMCIDNIDIITDIYDKHSDAKLYEVFSKTKIENLKYIVENITKNIDDLKELKGLGYANPENLKTIVDNVSKNKADLLDMEKILESANTENLKIIVDNVSTDPNDLIKLEHILGQSQTENLQYIVNNVSKNVEDLIKLQKVLQFSNPENLKTMIEVGEDDPNRLVELTDILTRVSRFRTKFLAVVYNFLKENLDKELDITEYLVSIFLTNNVKEIETFIKNIENNDKGFYFGYFVEATKLGIEIKNNPVNKENFLDYIQDDNCVIFEFEKDMWSINSGIDRPFTKNRFLKNQDRLEYLNPEKIETFRKFGTVIGLGIMEGTENIEKLRGFYDYMFKNISLDKSRSSILQLGEVLNLVLREEKYDLLDEAVYGEEKIGLLFKSFVEEHKISDKGRTILSLMITREINSSFAIHKNKEGESEVDSVDLKVILMGVFEKLKMYKKIIDKYKNTPIKTSVGMEYEVTQGIVDGYKEITKSDYVNDIKILSEYVGIGEGNDAKYEIATKPTDNPYLLLLELELLEDLDFLDINFKREDYKKGSRSLHITLGGEYGVKYDKNANFIQNILVASNFGGINMGEEVSKINNYSNIRDKGSDCEALFDNKKTECTEYRSLSIDKAEPFGRLLISIFNLNMAKQLVDKYIGKQKEELKNIDNYPDFRKEVEIINKNNKENIVNIGENDMKIIYEFLRLKFDIYKIIENHNNNFIKDEILLGNDELLDVESTTDLLDFMRFWNSTGIYVAKLHTIFSDVNNLKLFIGKEIRNETEFRDLLEENNIKTEGVNRSGIYMYYKKRLEKPLMKILKNKYISENLAQYLNTNFKEIENKAENSERLKKDYKSMSKEDFMNYISIDKEDFERYIEPDFINKFTRINNFFLKKDTINAFNSLATTIEGGEKIQNNFALESTIFEKVERGLVERMGPNEIQKSSDNMITKAIQKRILEFNNNIQGVLKKENPAIMINNSKSAA